jgi:hypothetical protein
MAPTLRGLLAIIILVIIVVSVGAVGWILINTSKQESTNSSTITPTSTGTPKPTIKPIPTATQSPIPILPLDVVSVSLQQPYNPGGPTISVSLRNSGTVPVVALQAMLSLSGRNYTYIFSDVSSNSPLLPNQETTQTATLLGASFSSDQAYLLRISGEQQDGTPFGFVTNVTIATLTPSPSPTEAAGGLKLTMTIEKTYYVLSEAINITLTITNISNQTINFTHTGQDFDFLVYNDTNNLLYQWSKGRAFPLFITIIPLNPHQNITANYVWQQTYNSQSNQNAPVSPGTYNIEGETGSIYGLQTPPIQVTIVNSQFSTQEQVRDEVMCYIQSSHPETAQFMQNIVWTGGRTTPPNLIGAETYMYFSRGWNFTISYPVVPNAIYTITADYSSPSTGIPYRIIWQGIWQNGTIKETRYTFAQ